MIKGIVISLAKKYVIGSINELLEKNKDNVRKISDTIALWMIRLQKIKDELENINERVADAKLEDHEIKDSIAEIEVIVREWK